MKKIKKWEFSFGNSGMKKKRNTNFREILKEGNSFILNGNDVKWLEGELGKVSVVDGEITKLWKGSELTVGGISIKSLNCLKKL